MPNSSRLDDYLRKCLKFIDTITKNKNCAFLSHGPLSYLMFVKINNLNCVLM